MKEVVYEINKKENGDYRIFSKNIVDIETYNENEISANFITRVLGTINRLEEGQKLVITIKLEEHVCTI
jgi:hypothetical protein